ncbi:AbrB/MazE/SpoVT family DNA-binding domain-containing protein [Candidatus Woesearchaeota archaeon]|nr:AbrB/MazE/SpoVT family DNA-binding domain-containing protein [Candidatus Woesearchaeota archaeon]
MGTSKITRNYQVTLPKDVRKIGEYKIGDKVLFMVKEGRLELVKMDTQIIEDAAGLWKETPERGIEYENRVRKGWKNRLL